MNKKSQFVSFILILILGPFGLLYTRWKSALAFTFFFGIPVYFANSVYEDRYILTAAEIEYAVHNLTIMYAIVLGLAIIQGIMDVNKYNKNASIELEVLMKKMIEDSKNEKSSIKNEETEPLLASAGIYDDGLPK